MKIMEIGTRIAKLKLEKNVIIFAHNYQLPEVQEIADFTGDSLELARKGAQVKEDVIVFCGVHFMAETAAMLSPEKTVLLPDERAGCPMADMASGAALAQLKARHPGAVVVCYVNSTANVKALSDVCCTSANAITVVSRIPRDQKIIFVPDKYLGGHISRMTGRDIILWEGYCPTHAKILEDHIHLARQRYPKAPIIVHPESREEVCLAADEVLSTGQMCLYAKKSTAKTIVIGTEVGLLYRLRKENPGKTFVPLLKQAICPNMKRTTVEKILWSLQNMAPVIKVPAEVAAKANHAVKAMFENGPITGGV